MAPKQRPILFSGPMVRALLAGTKTQTRRVVKSQPSDSHIGGASCYAEQGEWVWLDGYDGSIVSRMGRCPYGAPGDTLWVRETWLRDIYTGGFQYFADHPAPSGPKWKPSIHMPRWASRITLEVTGVRVERLHDISEADARAEGIVPFRDGHGWHTEEGRHYAGSAIDAYLNLWAEINGEESAKANPFVWSIEFRKAASGCSQTAEPNEQDQSGSSHG